MPQIRVSDKFASFIDDYRKKHNVSREEASDAILQMLPPEPKTAAITSDVPLGMPVNPEKQKALEQLKQESYEVTELPLPQCNFVGKGYIDHKLGVQMIYCGNPKKYKSGHEAVPLSICAACYKRMEWGKEKREREQEENPTNAEPELIEAPNCKERYLNYKGAENDPNAVHDFGEKGVKGIKGKKIYCMRFCEWKTLEWCIDCFKGGKGSTTHADVSEIESRDIGETDF